MKWEMAAALVIFGVTSGGCGSSSTTSPPPPVTVPPTTTPVTQPTPPPITAGCASPTPPPLYGVKLSVQQDQGYRKLVDSRPVVLNVDGYCGKVGFYAGAKFCDTRPEGDAQREACDALAMGKNPDNGRYGPKWSFDGRPCAKSGDAPPGDGCIDYDPNQFLVVARGTGLVLACAADDVPATGARCGGCAIDPSAPRCQ